MHGQQNIKIICYGSDTSPSPSQDIDILKMIFPSAVGNTSNTKGSIKDELDILV